MHQANIHEAKANLSQLIKYALAGDEVIIARNNEPLVRMVPVEQDVSPRIGGFWAGQITYHGDWADMDKEIEELFNASKIFPSEAQ